MTDEPTINQPAVRAALAAAGIDVPNEDPQAPREMAMRYTPQPVPTICIDVFPPDVERRRELMSAAALALAAKGYEVQIDDVNGYGLGKLFVTDAPSQPSTAEPEQAVFTVHEED